MATMVLISGIISLIFGMLVLSFPAMLRYTIGIYFIVVGLINLISSVI